MIRILVFFTAAICAASLATAEPAPAPVCTGVDMFEELRGTDPQAYAKVNREAAAWINHEAILWKLEKPGAAPSYLFGTVHVSDPRVTTLSPAVETAFAAAKTVIVEVADLSDGAMSAAMVAAPESLAFSDGRSLEKLLTVSEYEKVKGIVAKNEMPPDAAAVVRPWLVSLLLAVSDCEKRQVAAGAVVLDDKITRLAKAQGKQLVGLETAPDQLKALSGINEDQQLQMLKASLYYADRLDDTLETILQMYLRRRMSAAIPLQTALAAKAGVPASAFEDFVAKLIVARNLRMLDGALPLVIQGGAFIAVGGLHLPGQQGLVALFRNAGVTVTAIE